MTDILAEAAARLEADVRYSRDVVQWANAKLGAFLWSKQIEISNLLQSARRVAVPSCHDVGKSWLAALLGCHHIDTHVAGEAQLITTAPSHTQVRGVLWNEIGKMHRQAADRGTPMQGRVTQTEWKIGGWLAGIGRKPNDYTPVGFQGFHSRYPLIIVDEADGVPLEMWEGLEALMTSKNARMLGIGNPLDSGSRFATHQESEDWEVVRISYLDSPNFTGEKVPEYLRDLLLSKEWVDLFRRQVGEDSPLWYGRVLAEYPPEALATIIRLGYVTLCRENREDEPAPSSGFVQLGVDVAGSENGDETVVRERVGEFALREWRLRSPDDDEIEDFIVDCAMKANPNRIVMDATGLGFGFTGRIRKRVRGTQVVPVNFGSKAEVTNADGSRKYENMRAQLWWETGREKMRQGEINISRGENMDVTIADLTSARYDPEQMAKGIIKVESKNDIKRRLGRSPDGGDSFLLSFHEPRTTGGPVKVPDMSRFQFPLGASSLVRT